MAEKIKIVDMKRLPSPDPQRMGKTDRLFVVDAGSGNRLVVRLPDEEFDEDKLAAAVKAELAERGAWIGRELEI